MGVAPRTRDTSQVTVTIRHDFGAPATWDDLEGGLKLPRHFEADVDDPALLYLLTLTIGAQHRRLVIERAAISQRVGQPPVTSAGLRLVTLDAYLGAVRQELLSYGGAFLLAQVRSEAPGLVEWSPPTAEALERFDARQRHTLPRGEALERVAEAYRAALASPDPAVFRRPTKAVGDMLHYSRGHAARLVTAARKADLLGPAFRGRSGEDIAVEGGAS